MALPETDTIDCADLHEITKAEFEANFVQADTVIPNPAFKKTGLNIKVPDTDIVFEDDTTEAGYQEYFAEGSLSHFYVVEQLDYQSTEYYLISREAKETYDLVGRPKLYGNTILSIEGEHVDSPVTVELWQLANKKLAPNKIFAIGNCDIFNIIDTYLNKNYLYIKHMALTDKYVYVKLKIS